tara:strand:+ start:1821 stop:2423 length:603 start_codon:yes stop_codon:yes gene_type:complete
MKETVNIFSNSILDKFFIDFFNSYKVVNLSLDKLYKKEFFIDGGVIFINNKSDLEIIGSFEHLQNFLIISDQSLETTKIDKDLQTLKTPTDLNKIKTGIKNFLESKEISFEHLKIINRKLINKENKKECLLTDIENEILHYLIQNKICTKKEINNKILNLSPIIESNSLDSHLSRIRKKFEKINLTVKIQSKTNQLKIFT